MMKFQPCFLAVETKVAKSNAPCNERFPTEILDA
jgi:hypothetical protein